jgi:Rrf2 family protein
MVRVSNKADYALRAALDLALNAERGQLVSTAAIARRTKTPSKFLEAILVQLGAAGLVESQRGAKGGYRLKRPAGAVKVSDVLEVAGVQLGAREPGPRRAVDGPSRAIGRLWTNVESAVREIVDRVTLEDLARDAQQASSVADYSI